ncbi:MAG: hypothetical protein LC754_09890 [Acidobacteria bacterium]|nr:hypothetical protein [Acidobacteriota bacterium]
MARGWESKAVEAQMEESDARQLAEPVPFEVSPAVRARRERLDSLRMARARTLEQLERANGSAHREMLKRTLVVLEREMNELE